MNKLTRSIAGSIIAAMCSNTHTEVSYGASEYGGSCKMKQRKRRKADRRRNPHGF